MLEVHVCNSNGVLLRAFALGDQEEVIVGRDDRCDIRIGAQAISEEHCAIERNAQGMILRDLGSSTGTFLNGEPIDSIELREGMEFTVGPAVLKFYQSSI